MRPGLGAGTVALAAIVRHEGDSRDEIASSHWSLIQRPVQRSRGSAFPSEVITLAVRWYLRFGLSYRDVEELLAE